MTARRPNVLLLTVDALRADRTTVHGYRRPTTPALARLAERAVVCERAFSLGPFTQSACVQMFTSSRPLSYGGYDAGATGRPETLFKRFHDAGYHTTALSTLHWVNRFFGYGDGLDAEHQLFTPNTLVGVAVANMRNSLQAYLDGDLPEPAMHEVVLPVVAKLFRDAEAYCRLRMASRRADRADYPDSLLVNAGYDYARMLKVIARHRDAFEADGPAYVRRHLESVPQPHEWLGRDWNLSRHAGKLVGEALFRLTNRIVHAIDPRLATLRRSRFKHYVDAPALADKTISLLGARNAERPFFLWAHFMDTHIPYVSGRGRRWYRETPGYLARLGYPRGLDPGANFRSERPENGEDGDTISALYDAAVLSTDEQIGRIVEAVEALGLADDTLIVVCGDHGEELGDHGDFGHYFLFYEHTVRVPMLYRGPGLDARRVDGLATSLDLAPSIAAMAGLASAPGWEGAPVTDDAVAARDHVLMETFYGGNCVFERPLYFGVRGRRFKFLWKEARDPRDRFSPDGPELYDLDADPGERRNLFRPDHPLRAGFEAVIARRMAEMPEVAPGRIAAAFGEAPRASAAAG